MNYGMFSSKGNKLVGKIVAKVLKLPITAKKKDIYKLLTEEFNILESKHEEVWDTDVRESVIGIIEQKTKKELSIYF